jgi:hypothetical protein
MNGALANLMTSPRTGVALLALIVLGAIFQSLSNHLHLASIALRIAILLYLSYGALTGRRSAALVLSFLLVLGAGGTILFATRTPIALSSELILSAAWATLLVATAGYLCLSPAMRRSFVKANEGSKHREL